MTESNVVQLGISLRKRYLSVLYIGAIPLQLFETPLRFVRQAAAALIAVERLARL